MGTTRRGQIEKTGKAIRCPHGVTCNLFAAAGPNQNEFRCVPTDRNICCNTIHTSAIVRYPHPIIECGSRWPQEHWCHETARGSCGEWVRKIVNVALIPLI